MRFYRVEHKERQSCIDYNYTSTLGKALELAKKYASEEAKDIDDPFHFCIWEEVIDDPNYIAGVLVAKVDWFGELIDLPHINELGWEYDPETLKPRYPNPADEGCEECQKGTVADRERLGIED